MNWKEVLGLIGGGAGIVALIKVGIDVYNAKSNKTTVDLGNMQQMLDDALKRYDALEKKFNEFVEKTHEYVEELRQAVTNRDDKIDKLDGRVNKMEKIVNVAWRCKYPDNVEDCPVIQEYEKRHLCDGCEHSKKEE